MNALDPNKTIIFINQFITHTTKFLNRFSSVCEEVSSFTYCLMHYVLVLLEYYQKLADLALRIQRLEISLNILEAKVMH